MSGTVFVISAPSGAGKSTVCDMVVARRPHIHKSISFTSRSMRKGEEEGVAYYFITKKEFERKIERGDFIEYTNVYGNYYGTARKTLEDSVCQGRDIILDIDVIGGENIKKLFPGSVLIYLVPPSWDILKQRLVSRGTDTAQDIAKRQANIKSELAYINVYDYVVINDILKVCVEKILTIIDADSYKLQKNIKFLQGLKKELGR